MEFDPVGPGWTGLPAEAVEVGCVVHPSHWNRGIATEATLLAVADCFDRVGIDRLVALTTLDNGASVRALEKLGARRCVLTQHEDDDATYELFELAPASHRGHPPLSGIPAQDEGADRRRDG